MVATACSLVRVSVILNFSSILVDSQSDGNSNTSKAKQIENLQDGVKGATSFHQTKYLENNPQKANSAAKDEGLEPRQKDNSDSDDCSPKRSGWFSEKQVTSFQYDELGTWYHHRVRFLVIIGSSVLLGITQQNRRSVLDMFAIKSAWVNCAPYFRNHTTATSSPNL
jgi:hypothetical protein